MRDPDAILVSAYCGATIWLGFFGGNSNGDQGECSGEIEFEVDREEWDVAEIDSVGDRVIYVDAECPKCGSIPETEQSCSLIEQDTKEALSL